MAARMRGARVARGDALVFLDAHCEPSRDWLRPLLQRLRDKPDSLVTPIIDVIDEESFKIEYSEEVEDTQVGGFIFSGHFTWIKVPQRELNRRESAVAPTWSATMAGGLFAVNRRYFWEIGGYDEQMAGWGGENLELSFRVWMCGGTLETIPCSRVGHVFRAFHPYGMPSSSDTHGINTARMAEVWMDDYKELYYLHRPDLRNSPHKIGDITHRKVLREKLRCKSFQWYLDNIYPEKFVPIRDTIAYGRFQNAASNLCLDNIQREGDSRPLGLYGCHNELLPSQTFSLTPEGVLRDEEACSEVRYHTGDKLTEHEGLEILMFTCGKTKKGQTWEYLPTTQLRHKGSGLCLDARTGGQNALVKPCSAELSQQWDLECSEQTDFKFFDEVTNPERDAAFERIRSSRRNVTVYR